MQDMKTYETYLHSLDPKNPNDKITFCPDGQILSWEIWSDFLMDWVLVPLAQIEKQDPNLYRLAEKFIEERAALYSKPIIPGVG